MNRPSWLVEVGLLHSSSQLILATLAGLVLGAGVLYAVGLIGWALRVLGIVVRGAVRVGFLTWEALLSWAPWPLFLAAIIGLLAAGIAVSAALPAVTVGCALILILFGATACLAYMFIDLERYEVERGYKAVHNPLKGQELALYLPRYGHRFGVPLLASAAVGAIGGFALLNLGLYLGGGQGWYTVGAGGGDWEVGYADFLAYALLHLFSIVDLLNLADSHHLLRVAHVQPAAWPASALMGAFKAFFTMILLQQIFASVRKGKLLAETVADFWSPHEPIHERARAALPQFGAAATRPLLVSLRSAAALTEEQLEQVPEILAAVGPSCVPALVAHLRDSHDHVRAVCAAALGRLHAVQAVSFLAPLAQDPSDIVRRSVAEALGLIAAAAGSGKDKGTGRTGRPGSLPVPPGPGWWRLLWWGRRRPTGPPPTPAAQAVATLRAALGDPSAAVRIQAVVALGRVGETASSAAVDLTGLLRDADETVRCHAATALGQVAEPGEAIPALVGLLQDPSSPVKAAAARALGEFKGEARDAVAALVPLLQDREEVVRQAAADAVGQIGSLPGESAHAAVEGLINGDDVVRARAAEALGSIGEAAAEAAPSLAAALEDGNDRVRAKAVEALGKIGEAAAEVAVPGLVRALRDPDNWVRALAAEALGEMGEAADDAIPALVRSLKHGNPEVRANAAEALGKVGAAAARAVPALEEAARDEDGAVRAQAVRALGEIGAPAPSTGVVLRAALADPDSQARAAGVEALGKWGGEDDGLQADLLRLLQDANDQVKVQAIRALPGVAGAASPAIEGLCHRLLEDDSAWVRAEAAQALGRLGPVAASAGAALLRAAQTGEATVREQAMRALVLVQPPEASEAFTSGLEDASEDVRKIASAGWLKAEVIPEEAVPALVGALSDPEVQVRANAARALARLDPVPDEAVPLLAECATDASDAVRLSAALALQAAAPSAARSEVLLRLVADPNTRVRLVAAGPLLSEDAANASAASVVSEALASPTAGYRRAAVGLVESLGAAGVALLDVLKQRAVIEEDVELRGALAQLVERLERPAELDSATGPQAG